MSFDSLTVESNNTTQHDDTDSYNVSRKLVPTIFSNIPNVYVEPELEVQFLKDAHPMKINLMETSFEENEKNKWNIPIVNFASKIICSDEFLTKEEISPFGLKSFRDGSNAMLLGYDHEAIVENKCVGIQTLSRTGAVRLVAEYLLKYEKCNIIYISLFCDQPNESILQKAGFKTISKYRHWNPKVKKFDLNYFFEDLKDAPVGSAIMFHACGYDGCNPKKDDWVKMAKFLKMKQIIPIFDIGCQGFATGDLDKDVWSVRYFISYGFELFCIKNVGRTFGLSNTCIGSLTIITDDSLKIIPMQYKFSQLIKTLYGSPPVHGALIISYIMSNEDAYTEWIKNFRSFSKIVQETRSLIRSTLECVGTPGDWSIFTDQKGFYTYTSLSEKQIEYLKEKHHVYLYPTGKLSMSGVNHLNVEYIASAIKDAIKNVSS